MREYVIGFDVGGTRAKSGAVTRGGRMLAPGINPSGFALGMGNLLKTLKDEVARISQRLGGKPQAIGLGFPGAVDPEVGVVYMPGKIKGLEGLSHCQTAGQGHRDSSRPLTTTAASPSTPSGTTA